MSDALTEQLKQAAYLARHLITAEEKTQEPNREMYLKTGATIKNTDPAHKTIWLPENVVSKTGQNINSQRPDWLETPVNMDYYQNLVQAT